MQTPPPVPSRVIDMEHRLLQGRAHPLCCDPLHTHTLTRTEQVVETRRWFFLLVMEWSCTGKNMGQMEPAEQSSPILSQGAGVFHHILQRFQTR